MVQRVGTRLGEVTMDDGGVKMNSYAVVGGNGGDGSDGGGGGGGGTAVVVSTRELTFVGCRQE